MKDKYLILKDFECNETTKGDFEIRETFPMIGRFYKKGDIVEMKGEHKDFPKLIEGKYIVKIKNK